MQPNRHPQRVAEASLEHARETKAPLYAERGVPEYWIVDAGARRVEVYSLKAGAYQPALSLRGGAAHHAESLRSHPLPRDHARTRCSAASEFAASDAVDHSTVTFRE